MTSTFISSVHARTDRWFHYDQVGTVISTTDADGTAVDMNWFDAFGNRQEDWETGLVAPGGGWGLHTKSRDPLAGMHYMSQRWYAPDLGVFASVAPASSIEEHSYSFGDQNPVSKIDPRGTQFFPAGGVGQGLASPVAQLIHQCSKVRPQGASSIGQYRYPRAGGGARLVQSRIGALHGAFGPGGGAGAAKGAIGGVGTGIALAGLSGAGIGGCILLDSKAEQAQSSADEGLNDVEEQDWTSCNKKCRSEVTGLQYQACMEGCAGGSRVGVRDGWWSRLKGAFQ